MEGKWQSLPHCLNFSLTMCISSSSNIRFIAANDDKPHHFTLCMQMKNYDPCNNYWNICFPMSHRKLLFNYCSIVLCKYILIFVLVADDDKPPLGATGNLAIIVVSICVPVALVAACVLIGLGVRRKRVRTTETWHPPILHPSTDIGSK